MLSCKQASQIISQSLDRPLAMRERFALNLHLFICKYCKRFSQHIQCLRVAIKQMTNSIENDNTIEMPLEAKKRIANLAEANRTQPKT
jgi:hypothetical protein